MNADMYIKGSRAGHSATGGKACQHNHISTEHSAVMQTQAANTATPTSTRTWDEPCESTCLPTWDKCDLLHGIVAGSEGAAHCVSHLMVCHQRLGLAVCEGLALHTSNNPEC
jgi:hypothetical protein